MSSVLHFENRGETIGFNATSIPHKYTYTGNSKFRNTLIQFRLELVSQYLPPIIFWYMVMPILEIKESPFFPFECFTHLTHSFARDNIPRWYKTVRNHFSFQVECNKLFSISKIQKPPRDFVWHLLMQIFPIWDAWGRAGTTGVESNSMIWP